MEWSPWDILHTFLLSPIKFARVIRGMHSRCLPLTGYVIHQSSRPRYYRSDLLSVRRQVLFYIAEDNSPFSLPSLGHARFFVLTLQISHEYSAAQRTGVRLFLVHCSVQI